MHLARIWFGAAGTGCIDDPPAFYAFAVRPIGDPAQWRPESHRIPVAFGGASEPSRALSRRPATGGPENARHWMSDRSGAITVRLRSSKAGGVSRDSVVSGRGDATPDPPTGPTKFRDRET